MGQKTHPYGFRLGVIKTWTSKWYEDKAYMKWLHEDIRIKRAVKDYLYNANIASVEVERALCAHPAVMEAAVVAGPDPKWGEVPIAFVTLKAGAAATEEGLIAYAREHIAHFKAPKRVLFGELPRNATGKIQKFVLRERARALMKGVS